MSTSRLLLTSMLVSSTLIMGACGNKDKGATDKIAASTASMISGDKVDAKAFEKLLKVESRKTSEAEAKMALEKMGFDASNDGMMTWTESSGSEGSYTYSNLSATGDDGEDIKIAELSFTGVHMAGDNPTFDRVDMEGINVVDGDNTASVANLSISNPSPKVGAAIVKFVENIDSLDDLDIDLDMDDGELPFGTMLMSGLSVKADGSDIALGSLGWNEDKDTNKGVFMLEGLNVAAEAKRSGSPIKVSLASISGTGLDMNYFRSMSGADKSSMKPGGFNPFAKTFDNFALDDLSVNVDTLSLATDGIYGKASEKGDVTTMTQTLKPFTLSFTGDAQDPQIAQMQQTLAMAGFEEIVMSANSTSKLDKKADSFEVTDSQFSVKDAFDMNFSYSGTGLSAIEKSMGGSDGAADLSSEEIDAMLQEVALGHFEMALTDNSIIDKILTIASQQQGTTPELMKMQAKSGLMMLGMAAQTEAQGKALTDLSSALGKLLDQGGTLKISLRPESPVAMSELKDIQPDKIDPAMLGFSVEHKK